MYNYKEEIKNIIKANYGTCDAIDNVLVDIVSKEIENYYEFDQKLQENGFIEKRNKITTLTGSDSKNTIKEASKTDENIYLALRQRSQANILNLVKNLKLLPNDKTSKASEVNPLEKFLPDKIQVYK